MGKALQKPAQGRALGEPFRFHSHPPSGSRNNLIDRYCFSIADGAEYGEVALHACLLGYEVHGPQGSGARNFIQSAILVIGASLKGFDWFFPFKEAHLSAYLLQGAISLRMSWATQDGFV